MRTAEDRIESEERHGRLLWAVKQAGHEGKVSAIAEALGKSRNTIKGHLSGRNDFGSADGRAYARFLGVSLAWLYLGLGSPDDAGPPIVDEQIRDVMMRTAAASEEVRTAILSYATFALREAEKSGDTATNLAL